MLMLSGEITFYFSGKYHVALGFIGSEYIRI
jgi:hypothetical protein